MNGLWIKDNEHFAVLLEPLLPKFEQMWWYFDCQMWPINFPEENETLRKAYEDSHVNVNCLKRTLVHVWRPGILPMFAPYVSLDEWSDVIGFKAEENQVEHIASELWGVDAIGDNEHYSSRIERYAEIYILGVDDGLLYIFSPHQDWLELLHERWPQSEYVTLNQWREQSGW